MNSWKEASMKTKPGFFIMVAILALLFEAVLVSDRVIMAASLDGVWPTLGFSSDQSRSSHKTSAVIPGNPSLIWSRQMPVDRFTMFFGSAAIGPEPDSTIYIPFFGGGWDTGGIQALTSDGELKWYFKSSEVEGKSPVVLNNNGKTMILVGNNRSINAIYDTPDARCCVKVNEGLVELDGVTSAPQFEYCQFVCEADTLPCEQGTDGYEWRHRLYDDPANRTSVNQCPAFNAAFGWNLDLVDLPGVDPESYLEVSSTPLLSEDGNTAYFLISRENYVVAVDVDTGEWKWTLGEQDPYGWIGAECPDAVNYPDDLLGTPVLLSDGSFVFGTSGGCIVRIVDLGTEGRADGIYRHDPPWPGGAPAPVTGLTLDKSNDDIYVATHGLTKVNEGFIYKTSKTRLTNGTGAEWTYLASRAVTDLLALNKGGIPGEVALAEIDGVKYLYACVVDQPFGNPDMGWIVRIPADGPGAIENRWWEMGKQLRYTDDLITELKIDANWYPAYNCVVDGSGSVYLHGGLNRQAPGRIMCLDSELNHLWDYETIRFGYSEVALGNDYLIAVAHGAWFPKPVFFLPFPQDWFDAIKGKFNAMVYKLGLPH